MIGEPTPSGDTSGAEPPGSHAPGGDVQYLFTTVKAIRGREGATRTKFQNEGWEFVNQTQGALRSELTFRKVKPKGIGAYLAQGYAAFRGLQPKTQKVLLGVAGGLVAALVIVGGVAAAGGDAPGASKPAAATEDTSTASEPTPESTEEPTSEPTPSATPEAEPYVYRGPKYEVVIVDSQQGPAKLQQYWIHTAPAFDFANRSYKKQVKLIISDVAQEQDTPDFIANVVTNREIAEAESASTFQDFIAEHGDEYAINTIPKLEVEGWVASYTGGFNPNTGKPSDAASAYEVIWRPYATSEIEQWKPVPAGS